MAEFSAKELKSGFKKSFLGGKIGGRENWLEKICWRKSVEGIFVTKLKFSQGKIHF
jgi:hypothetical protein